MRRTCSPDGRAVDEEPLLDRIRQARPHILLVAFGAPKQELFIHGALASLRPAVAIGVGAGFDFIAERVRRAPRWMSKSGLEWLFRLAQEPRRLAKRYLVDDPQFLSILYRTMRAPKSERIINEEGLPSHPGRLVASRLTSFASLSSEWGLLR